MANLTDIIMKSTRKEYQKHSKHIDASELEIYLSMVAGGISVITFMIAVVSWTSIPKWRNFKNFIFSNMVLSFVVTFILGVVFETFFISDIDDQSDPCAEIYPVAHYFLNFHCRSVFCCWLLIASFVFYSDLVIVFKTEVTRRFLKSALFAWGVPTPITIMKISTNIILIQRQDETLQTYWEDIEGVEILLDSVLLFSVVLVNVLTFALVLYCLMKKTGSHWSSGNCRTLQFAVLTFVMSGIMMLGTELLIVWSNIIIYYNTKGNVIDSVTNTLSSVSCIIYKLQIIAVNIFFLALKSNRTLLKDYICSKLKGSGE